MITLTFSHNGEKITLSHGAYSVCLHGEDRALREKAFKKYYKAYEKNLNVITANYIASVNKDVFLAKARKYGSALERAMSGEEIDKEVYDNLLKFTSNLFRFCMIILLKGRIFLDLVICTCTTFTFRSSEIIK